MTHSPKSTPTPNPWDVMSVYAVSLGLFAPGALMAARMRAAAQASSAAMSQGQ